MREPDKKGSYGDAWIRKHPPRTEDQQQMLICWYVRYGGLDLAAHGWFAAIAVKLRPTDTRIHAKAKYELQFVPVTLLGGVDGPGWKLAGEPLFVCQLPDLGDQAVVGIPTAVVQLWIENGVAPQRADITAKFIGDLLKRLGSRMQAFVDPRGGGAEVGEA